MNDQDISDAQLLAALKRADDQHIAEGLEPGARQLMNVAKALAGFGIHTILLGNGAPPIVGRTRKLNDTLFTPKAIQVGCLHLGAFLFRDMFCQLHAPIVFGQCRIDFWQLIDLNEQQKRWLAESPDDLARFMDQSIDILDFGFGWTEFGHTRSVGDRAKDLIWRSHTQLEAAAATATGAGDFRGTVQSALLGAELAIKAGLAANNVSEEHLAKKIGHNLKAGADLLAEFEPGFEVSRVQRVIQIFPNFVESRYKAPPPNRVDVGHILMGAQYIAAEVTRQFTNRNGRVQNSATILRVYPA